MVECLNTDVCCNITDDKFTPYCDDCAAHIREEFENADFSALHGTSCDDRDAERFTWGFIYQDGSIVAHSTYNRAEKAIRPLWNSNDAEIVGWDMAEVLETSEPH